MTIVAQSLRASLILLPVLGLAPLAAPAAEGYQIASGRILVKPKAGMTEDHLDKVVRGEGGGRRLRHLRGLGVRVIEVSPNDELAMIRRLKKNPNIAFAEPDFLVAPIGTATDPSFPSQWHLPLMGAPTAWDYASGKGVIVAVCDTGVNASHPDLVGQTVAGWNTAANSADTSDIHGHGTWVSGVVAAKANNGVGGASVAPAARIMTMRITDRTDGYAYFSDMAECVTWAADHGARVANISFGGVPGSSTIASAASYMMDKGGVVVVSAGNDNADMGYTNSPYLFTAAATTSSDVRASYSNFGTYVDIAAPGSSIFTTDRGGGYASVSGTSFASPNAAATIALVMSANPSLTPTDVTSIVVQTAKDLGDAGWDANYGFGRVDAGAATALAANVATNDSTPPAVALKSPGTGTTVSQSVPVSVNATDAFGVTRVDLLVDGVVRASETQQVETGVYAFAWDSTAVGDGSHRIAAQAVDAAGNVGKAQDVIVTVANTKDTTPPVVTISSPAPNAKASGSVSISAYATDNKGVTELKVYGNGALLCAGTSSASCSWSLTNVSGTATISATAKDAAGNQATSSVNVTVSTTTVTYPRKKPRRY